MNIITNKIMTTEEWMNELIPSRETVLEKRTQDLEVALEAIQKIAGEIKFDLHAANMDAEKRTCDQEKLKNCVHASAAACYGQCVLDMLTKQILPKINTIYETAGRSNERLYVDKIY